MTKLFLLLAFLHGEGYVADYDLTWEDCQQAQAMSIETYASSLPLAEDPSTTVLVCVEQ